MVIFMTTLEELSKMPDKEQEKFWEGLSAESIGRLMKWSEQLKVPVSELKEKFQAKLAALSIQLKDQNIPADDIESVTRAQFANDIRPGRSRAETFEGVVLGYSILRDYNRFWFNVAKGAFNKDPLQARMDGICDDHGDALVTNEIKERKGQYFRQNVGELLRHEWERHVLAIGRPVQRKKGDDTMRIFHIKLSGEPARFMDPTKFPAPPMGLVCRWRCNVQEVNTEWNWIRANGATVTRFEPATVDTSGGPVTGVFDAKRCAGLLNQVKTNFRSSISALKAWVDEHAREAGHFVVVEGEILNMYERSMRIGNADQLDLEDIPSLYINLDPTVPDQMNYGVNSTVIVACNPYERKARERNEEGQYVQAVDELGNPKKEIVADALAVFPLIAMPRQIEVVPEVVTETPATPPASEPEEEPEESTTIEL